MFWLERIHIYYRDVNESEMQNAQRTTHSWIIFWCFLSPLKMNIMVSYLQIAVFAVQMLAILAVCCCCFFLVIFCFLDYYHTVKFIAFWYVLLCDTTTYTYREHLTNIRIHLIKMITALSLRFSNIVNVDECECVCMLFLLQKCGLPLQCRFEKEPIHLICHKKTWLRYLKKISDIKFTEFSVDVCSDNYWKKAIPILLFDIGFGVGMCVCVENKVAAANHRFIKVSN